MSLAELLPDALHLPGPRGLSWWQWLALPLILAVSWPMGALAGRLTQMLFGAVARRTPFAWDDRIVPHTRGPFVLAWTMLLVYAIVPELGLPAPALEFIVKALRTALLLSFFWLLSRLVGVAREGLEGSSWAQTSPASRSLLPLGGRIAQVAVVAIAVIAVVAQLGYSVASLVAGLGIGGLALALAAQKTVENLFGAFSISVDQSFRVGDAIKLDGVEGNVEAIGLRSTRIRTADRSIVTLPNGKVAEMRIESFTERDRIRFACDPGLVYGTTAAQVKRIIAEIEAALRAHPKIWQEAIFVKLKRFGPSSLDLEVNAWFQTTDWGEFLDIRQEMLLRIMEIVEGAGSAFAFPTQTVHLVQQNGERA
jgi:MscS family membrane protein